MPVMAEEKRRVEMTLKVKKDKKGKSENKRNLLLEIAKHLLHYAQEDKIQTPKARTEKVFLVHDVANKIRNMGHDPNEIMQNMMKKGYLVPNSKEPEIYYVFTVPAQGLRLAKYLAA